jgi:hypothetical protein
MPSKHAVLSASSSARWIACPPSARLNQAAEDSFSEYALEGTCAHSLAEFKAKRRLGLPAKDPTEDLTIYNQEMEEYADDYACYILELFQKAKEECKDPIAEIEMKLDLSRWIPDGFGTADCVIVSNRTLWITDLKYGSILVDSDHNSQLMSYALGAWNVYEAFYDIKRVVLTIYQPRRSHISSWEIPIDELLTWGEEVLKPAALLAFKGEGNLLAGPHCRFCKVKATCRARAEKNLEIAKYDFKNPERLEDEEIDDILSRSEEFISWVSDVKSYALSQALKGKHWPHHKLVEGRSVRRYTDDRLVAQVVENAGYDPYEQKLLGITAMTKMLGKKKFEEVLTGLVTKPPGKPTLVDEADKRPEVKVSSARDDFKEEN